MSWKESGPGGNMGDDVALCSCGCLCKPVIPSSAGIGTRLVTEHGIIFAQDENRAG